MTSDTSNNTVRSGRRVGVGTTSSGPQFSGDDFEAVPDTFLGNEAVVIDRIQKSFKPWGKPAVNAVNEVSLKIYPGEITAILGKDLAAWNTDVLTNRGRKGARHWTCQPVGSASFQPDP